MLVTPIEVYTSVNPTSSKHKTPPQRLLITQNEERAPFLIIQDTRKDHGKRQSIAKFKYTDCQYATGERPLYMEQLEQLLTRFSEGYSSAGVFINTRADDYDHEQRNMTKVVLEQLKRKLLELYVMQKNKKAAKKITVEYGLIGFSDEYCHNYPNRTRFDNSVANHMKISNALLPVELNDIDQAWDSLGNDHEREYPTLFVCHISDNHQFESHFAWIDIPPPQDHGPYSASYAEFVNRLKIYSNPEFHGVLEPSTYPMSHILLSYFSGSYQAMVFAHFNEYATYDTGINFDILHYTSNLRNIKCSVNKNESGIHLLQSQNNELQHELVKQVSINDKYKASNSKNLQKLTALKGKLDSYKSREHKLSISVYAAKATMDRQRTNSELEKADLMHQMNDLKIQLVESTVANRSYQLTIDELEQRIKNEERLKQWLSQCYTVNAKYIEALEQKIERMEDHAKSQSQLHEETLRAALDESTKKWKDAEELHIKQLTDKVTLIKELTKRADDLALKCAQLSSRNETIQLEMEKKIDRLEMKHDVELRKIRIASQKQQQQQQQQQQAKMNMHDHSKPTLTTQLKHASESDPHLPQRPSPSPEPQPSEPQSPSNPRTSSQFQSSSPALLQSYQMPTSSHTSKEELPIQSLPNKNGLSVSQAKPKPKPVSSISNTTNQSARETHTSSPSIDSTNNQHERETHLPPIINVDDDDDDDDIDDDDQAHLPHPEKMPPTPSNKYGYQQKHYVNITRLSPEVTPKPPQSKPHEIAFSTTDKKLTDRRPLSSTTTNTNTSDKPTADNILRTSRPGDNQSKNRSMEEARTSPPQDLDDDYEPLGSGESDNELFIASKRRKEVHQPQDNAGAQAVDHSKSKQKIADNKLMEGLKSKPSTQLPTEGHLPSSVKSSIPPSLATIRKEYFAQIISNLAAAAQKSSTALPLLPRKEQISPNTTTLPPEILALLLPHLPLSSKNLQISPNTTTSAQGSSSSLPPNWPTSPKNNIQIASNTTTLAREESPTQEESSAQNKDPTRKRQLTQYATSTQQNAIREQLEQGEIGSQEQTASQELRTTRKKRRKLRPDKSPIDESRMSPVLNGFTAKYFEID